MQLVFKHWWDRLTATNSSEMVKLISIGQKREVNYLSPLMVGHMVETIPSIDRLFFEIIQGSPCLIYEQC